MIINRHIFKKALMIRHRWKSESPRRGRGAETSSLAQSRLAEQRTARARARVRSKWSIEWSNCNAIKAGATDLNQLILRKRVNTFLFNTWTGQTRVRQFAWSPGEGGAESMRTTYPRHVIKVETGAQCLLTLTHLYSQYSLYFTFFHSKPPSWRRCAMLRARNWLWASRPDLWTMKRPFQS